jgi:glycosyltransferase involved in cell wall biosynthesis
MVIGRVAMNNEKRKVLCVLQVPVVPFQGASLRCVRQSIYLSDSGLDVVLLCLKVRNANYKSELISYNFTGVKVVPVLPNWGGGFFRELVGLFFAWFPIWQALRRERPAIVHVHNPPDTLAFVTSIICNLRGVPLVFDIHDLGPELITSMEEWARWKRWVLGTMSRILEWQILRHTSGIVTVSETLRDLLVRTRPIIHDRAIPVMVVRNTLSLSDGDWSAERKRVTIGARTEPYVLYTGSLYSGFMGLEDFMGVFFQVTSNDIEFYIAGDGPYRKQLENFVQRGCLTQRVRFLGYRPQSEIPALIRQARLCVTPLADTTHTKLALPKKVFEYMAMGKAVLYPDLPGFDEILGKDNPGRYKAGDLEDMKQVLKRLLFDDAARHEAEKMNYERFETVSYESEIEKLMGLYKQVKG